MTNPGESGMFASSRGEVPGFKFDKRRGSRGSAALFHFRGMEDAGAGFQWNVFGSLRIVSGMETCEVVCPTCFEAFEVVMPFEDELPAEVDYDCEVCCRPMVIHFTSEGAEARGLAD